MDNGEMNEYIQVEESDILSGVSSHVEMTFNEILQLTN